MRTVIGLTAAAFALAISVWSQNAAAQPVPAQMVFRDEIEIAKDGRYTEIVHLERRITDDSDLQTAGQQPIGYDTGLQDLDILEAFTLKPDGSRRMIDPAAVQTASSLPVPVLQMFNQDVMKVIVFPDVAIGDTIVATYRRRTLQPWFLGQISEHFAASGTDIRFIVHRPREMHLRTEWRNLQYEKSEDGETVTGTWRYPPKAPEDKPGNALGSASLYLSSFASYDDLARDYGGIVVPKQAVTPRIQALADQITAGIADRRARAVAIHDWVSRNIRYVAIYLGKGGVEPHPAESVLDNRYGDCKDHVVLYGALLKAAGIASEAVLISLGSEYKLAGPAVWQQFNHMIAYLPEFGLYSDTTASLADFGSLPLFEYGKPVVHLITEGNSLRRVPVLAPGSASVALRTRARLGQTGAITGESTTIATGPLAMELRLLAVGVEKLGPATAAAQQLAKLEYHGTGRFDPAPLNTLTPEYRVSGTFELEPRPGRLEGDSFPLPSGLRLLPRAGDLLMGPMVAASPGASNPTQCWSGHMLNELALDIPAGKRVRRLPPPLSLKSEHLQFESRWTVEGQTVSVRREFISNIDQPLCEGPVRTEAAKALAAIWRDYQAQISLEDDQAEGIRPSPAPSPQAPSPSPPASGISAPSPSPS